MNVKSGYEKGGSQTAKRRGASPADAYEHVKYPVYKHRNV
jgi:hypothetical protein